MKILRFAQNDSSRGIPQYEQPSVIQVLFLSHPELSHLSSRFCSTVILSFPIVILSYPICHPERSEGSLNQ